MKQVPIILVVCGLLLLSTPLAAQAEFPWKLPNLNPFKKDESVRKAPVRKSNKSDGAFGLKLPFWNSKKKIVHKPTAKRKGKSTFAKMNESTKEFFAKTKDVLTPWDNDPNIDSSRQLSSTRRQTAKKENKSSFFDMVKFKSKEEPRPKPMTPQEFLSQDRPDF